MEFTVTEETAQFEFDTSFQTKVAALIMRDTNFAMNTKEIVKPEMFTEDAAGTLVRIVHEHVKTYRAVPDMKILPTILKDEIAAKRIRPDMVDPVKQMVKDVMRTDLSNPTFVQDKVVDFAKTQAVISVMEKCVNGLIDRRDWGQIGTLMKE